MSESQAPLSRRSSSIHRKTVGPLPGLVVVQGTRAGTVHYVTPGIITIGQALDNDIQLDDRGVARHHAGIRWQRAGNGDVFQIYDLGSAASVQVNGVAIIMRHSVAKGDRITIGAAVLEFFIPGES